MTNNFNTIKTNIPLFYILLTVLGYLNYYFFYLNFNINITSYLSTFELVFSFLNLSVPFIFAISFVSVVYLIYTYASLRFFGIKVSHDNGLSRKIVINIFSFSTALGNFLESFSEDVPSKVNKFKFILFCLILLLTSSLVHVYLIGYPIFLIYQVTNPEYGISEIQQIMFGILWATFTMKKNLFPKFAITPKESENSAKWILIISLSVLLLWISKRKKAFELMQQHEESIQNITVKFENRLYETNQSFLYVGQTSSYLFFYDKMRSQTQVISKDGLIEFSVQGGLNF